MKNSKKDAEFIKLLKEFKKKNKNRINMKKVDKK